MILSCFYDGFIVTVASDFDLIYRRSDAKRYSRLFTFSEFNHQGKGSPSWIRNIKKEDPRAVDRNRFRRVIREYIRHYDPRFPVDIVVIARKTPDALWSLTYQQFLNQAFAKLTDNLEKACVK